ncbi:hypothetical protein N784_15935 [Pontibacillus litoralis JSM 072002]|uniref:Major facilitator superfamily (MFS) profile domain-containing protein n=1 Tax=Pontibacillus litoralis JSM 072002 TaxID=1385512 RepID=A0A0A5G8G4_9BACI|nr:hypothetical protein N784_15935 [Pontibacillus litoralis JSM 072002]
MPLIAINVLDASNFLVGLITTISFLPNLLLGFHAGAIADKYNRKKIMLLCQSSSAILLALIPLLYVLDVLNIWILLLITFLTGCCSLFFQLSGASYLPEILSPNQLIKGNANLQLTHGASQVMGPTIGGTIIQILTAPIAIIVDAFSFFISFIFTLFLPAKSKKSSNKKVPYFPV